ncbi:hypothetical protein AB7978_02450, partial [Streptococcus pyogenes]
MNKTKQNKTKQNKTKQNKTKQNKTKQNKTKHSLLCRYGLTSAAALLLAFGGASAVRADDQENKANVREKREKLLKELVTGIERIENEHFPPPGNRNSGDYLDQTYMTNLLKYLKERDQAENEWRNSLLKGIQDRAFDGQDGQ